MREKLSPFHIMILIYMTQLGVVVLRLPQILAETYGYNGWVGILPHIVLVSLNILLIGQVYRLGNGRSIFEIMEGALPKPIYYPVYVILLLVWGLIGCLAAKEYVLIFQMLSYPTTNPMLFKGIIDLLSFFLLIKSLYSIAKAGTAFFWISGWLPLLLLLYIQEFDFSRLTPFFFQEKGNVVEGTKNVFVSFLGFELCLLFFPYVDKYKPFIKAVMAGNLLTSAVYLALSFVAFGFFSLPQLKQSMFPVIDLFSFIKLPFIERLDSILYSFLLFSNLYTLVMYGWAALEVLQRMIPKGKRTWLAFFLLAAAFGIAWIPDTIYEVSVWFRYTSYFEIGICFAFPIFLILLLVLKRGRTNA